MKGSVFKQEDTNFNILSDPQKYFELLGKDTDNTTKTSKLLMDYIKPEKQRKFRRKLVEQRERKYKK